ncbi:cation:proton antiporter [Saccharopolyspora erythraea]|uniref:cation:proton antiporter n=1 Tax=Saccharopolyspora erythraea TaxID=1836 RepID=UPI001BA77F2E|nr:cation:proton antiporter [Saccharopolyspora erythraea]QUH04322.1 cation:proton antiporter [Saccharopolyspora erythraea]
MHDTALSLIELGAVFFGLGVLGRLAWKIGISPIPLYLLGGLAFGTGGLIPLHGIEPFTHLASEIGVVLLLLLLGLEYSAGELVTGLRRSWLAGLVDLVLNAAPGVIVALMLGWGTVGALTMAGVTYISSSGIVAKVLGDLGRLGNRETPVILSILVFEDLAMAVYLPILTAVLAGVTFFGGLTAVGISLVVITVVLIIALRFGRYVSALVDSPNPEVFLLRLLGAALLVAGIASELQVSAAVGAFLLGIAISGSTATNATRILEPLRDLFAAMFFVVFGLNTDPTAIPPVLLPAMLLAVATSVTKVATGWVAAGMQGVGKLGRARAGAALVARGEFSIVIAGLAVASGAVTDDLAALATTYVLLMAVIGPMAARFVEPVARRLMQRPAAQVSPPAPNSGSDVQVRRPAPGPDPAPSTDPTPSMDPAPSTDPTSSADPDVQRADSDVQH